MSASALEGCFYSCGMKVAALILLACIDFAVGLALIESLGEDPKHAEPDPRIPTVQGVTPTGTIP
jgi:hypothetical protein